MSLALPRPSATRRALGYLELTKPRIVSLVLFTGLPALLLAARGFPEPTLLVGSLAGIALAAAAAASFNHYFDRDIDRLMRRTASRPLPTGLLPPSHAMALGIALAVASWAVLALTTNLLAALLGQLSIVYYAVVYTLWLKRRTPQNIVIGGGAGASAPIIAWAAATGTVELPAIVMAAIVFFWTPPHFWALALYRREDYAHAGIPMLPVTHGEPETRRQIVFYTLILVPLTLTLAPLGVSGPLYWVPAAALGAVFLHGAVELRRRPEIPRAVRLFRFSILYLFALFALLTLDAVVQAFQAGSRP